VKTLPGAREAIEQRKWEEAVRQMVVIAGALEAYDWEIRRATAVLASAMK